MEQGITGESLRANNPDKQNWSDYLAAERKLPYFQKLLSFVEEERRAGKIIYPQNGEIFNALQFTPYHQVRVVILGQDPYHGPNQAHGLCFSVKPPTPPPPSLVNIFKEIKSDLGLSIPKHGCLESWAKQGVLLLNTCLTVEAGKAFSHSNLGWENFTNRVIEVLNDHPRRIVYLLWGSPAGKKRELVSVRHHVLTAPHPSPLSASRGFFGCKHFSATNKLLIEQGDAPIDWSLPEA